MISWIIIGVIIYLLIGVGLLIWAVKTYPWGGLLLEFAIPLILFYPYFLIMSLISRFRK